MNQSAPSVAKAAITLLVVWTDRRSALGTSSPVETDADIWGMLLNANGSPITTTPFPLPKHPVHRPPQASWNGTDWLVVFETLRDRWHRLLRPDLGGSACFAAGSAWIASRSSSTT